MSQRVQNLKKKLEHQMSELFKKHNVFFAFSDKQYEEGAALNPLEEGDKYVLLGSGMVMPESKVKQFNNDFEAITKAHSQAMNATPEIRREFIAYELANHEAYYTHEIEDALEAIRATIEDVTEYETWRIFADEQINNIG